MLDLATLDALLPDYARLDRAFRRQARMGTFTEPTAFLTPSGAQIEIPLHLTFTYDALNVVADRRVNVRLAVGSLSIQEFAIGRVITSNEEWDIEVIFGGAFYHESSLPAAPLNGVIVQSTQIMIVEPGQKLTFAVANFQTGDQIQNVQLTTLAVPTGPRRSFAAFTQTPIDPRRLAA